MTSSSGAMTDRKRPQKPSAFDGPVPVCGVEVSPELAEAFRHRLLHCWRACSRMVAAGVSKSALTDELSFVDFQRVATVALKGINVEVNSTLYHAMWEYLLGPLDGSAATEGGKISLPQLADAFEEIPFSLPEAARIISMRLLLQFDGFECISAHFRPASGSAVTRREFIMGLARVDVGESVASSWYSRLQAEGAEGGAGVSISQSLPPAVLQTSLLRAVVPSEDTNEALLASWNSGSFFQALAVCFIHEWGDLERAFGCSLGESSSPIRHQRVNPPPSWYSMPIPKDGVIEHQAGDSVARGGGMPNCASPTPSSNEGRVLGKSHWLRALRGQSGSSGTGTRPTRFFTEAEAQKLTLRVLGKLTMDGYCVGVDEGGISMASLKKVYLPIVGDILCCSKDVYRAGELATVKYTLAGPGFWGQISTNTTKSERSVCFPLTGETLGQKPFVAIVGTHDQLPNAELLQCRAIIDSNVTRGAVVLRIPEVQDLLRCADWAFKMFASEDGINPICQVGESINFTGQVSVPSAPGPVQITEVNSTSVCGEWAQCRDAYLQCVSHYDLGVWYATSSFGSPPLHVVPCTASDAPSHRGVVHSLEPGTAYYLRVRAVNSFGPGSWGPLLPCMPHFTTANIVPDAPLRSPEVVAVDAHRVKLHWIMESHDFHITHFFIEACRIKTPSTIRSVLLSVSETDVQGKEVVATVGQLEHNTEYTFTVKYMNESGTSTASPASRAVCTDPGPPAPPSEPIVRSDMGSIVLNWTAPSDTGGALISHYFVTAYKADSENGKSEPYMVRTIDASRCYETFHGLENATTYTFDVRAANRVGTGPASNRTAPFCCRSIVPSAPIQLQCVSWAGDVVTIQWNPPVDFAISAITAYTVMTIDTCADGDQIHTQRTPTESCRWILRGLQRNRIYAVFVFAENAAGLSSASERLDLHNPGLTFTPSMLRFGENRSPRSSIATHRPFLRPKQNAEHLLSMAERWREGENSRRACSLIEDCEKGSCSVPLTQFFPHANTLQRVNDNDVVSSPVSFVEPREQSFVGTPKASPRSSPQSSPKADTRLALNVFSAGKESPRQSPSPLASPRSQSPLALPVFDSSRLMSPAPAPANSRSSYPLQRRHRLNRSPSGALQVALAARTSTRRSFGTLASPTSPRHSSRSLRVEGR